MWSDALLLIALIAMVFFAPLCLLYVNADGVARIWFKYVRKEPVPKKLEKSS